MNRELNIFTLRMLREQYEAEHLDTEAEALEAAISALEDTDSAYAEGWTAAESKYRAMMSDGDCISRQAAIDAVGNMLRRKFGIGGDLAEIMLAGLPSAEPKQRYTEEELSVFAHGISLSLLSKRSAQHWRYDEDTATEIKFLERLYEKVGADIRGEEV